jgi:hypothetical protein
MERKDQLIGSNLVVFYDRLVRAQNTKYAITYID